MTTLFLKTCVRIKKKNTAFASAVALTSGSAWQEINVAQVKHGIK